jgi:predicted ABC-type ATPase
VPTLYLVIGPWGSGKSSTAEYLVPLIPDTVVFDWDLIIPGLSTASGKNVHSDASTWKGLRDTWAAIIAAVLAGQRDVVLCGPAGPEEIVSGPLAGASVRCAYLACSDPLLASRLSARGATAGEIADELAVAASLRMSSYKPVSVDNQGPREVAEEIAAWVLSER